MKKNLILGKGLIGSRLADFLTEKGEEIKVLSRSQGQDLRRAEDYLADFEWADRVWFVAWDVGVWKRENTPAYEIEVLESDLQLCHSVFHCLEETGKPFLFVSSHVSPDLSTLGVSKRVGELYTKLLGGHIARLWNVYGWEAPGERSHLVPDFVWKAFQGKLELMSDGNETRQFLYVQDCVEAFFHQFETGQKYADITSGEWVPLKTVAELIGKKLGAQVVLGTKPGKPSVYSPEVPLQLWKPRFSLDQGLDEVIKDAQQIWNQNKGL